MPFMQLKTNVAVTEQQETLLKTSFGSAITAIPGKSETWLMVGIEPQYSYGRSQHFRFGFGCSLCRFDRSNL